MKRTAGAFMLLAALGGCVTTESGPSPGMGGPTFGGPAFSCGGGTGTSGPSVPGIQGPWGQPITMAAPYSACPPGEQAARAMMARSMPMDLVQASAQSHAGAGGNIMLAGGPMPPSGAISPPGVPFQPGVPTPGGGAPFGPPPPAAVAAVGAITGSGGSRFPTRRTEIRFLGSEGMTVSWFAPGVTGQPGFSANTIVVPGRYNFVQGGVYRLRLSGIRNLPGVELYPTLEVVPSNWRSDAFLAHSSVPVTFTNEDFEQVAAGNFVVKVIYLPDPAFQDLAITGPDEIVSTRLDPGVDPIAEAYRRGSILCIVRLGNIDLNLANSPMMDAPNPYGSGACPPGAAAAPRMGQPGMPLPAMPASNPGLPPGAGRGPGPISELPDPSAVQQTGYKGAGSGSVTAAKLAAEMDGSAPPPDKKPESTRHWWWPGSNLGSK
jgi:hypothetical protein